MYRLQSMCFAATVATAALLGAPVQAQETGAVRGTVTLVENGGPVHGAVILVIGSGALGLTDEQGAFEIPGVPAGSYEVLAQREHLTAVRQAITVSPGETALVDFALGLSPVHEDVTVTASATGTETTFEAFNAVTTLDSFDLARASSGSLGEALQNEPGIASRSFGPGSSRPVIRGFDGDRVLILEDGVRTGDLSSQSGDHGVTIDPNSAERIEIVRGPATLLYGSNAVGGLVNVITPHESYRESLFEGTRAQFGTDGGSANRQAGTNGSLQRSQGNVLVWAGGSLRRSGDYDTPEGTIENSATELTNAQAGLGWFGDRFFASGGLTFEDGRYGVPFADEFHGHPEEEADHAEEAEDGTEEEHAEEIEVDLDSRRRVGRFDVGLRNLSSRVVDGVRVTLNTEKLVGSAAFPPADPHPRHPAAASSCLGFMTRGPASPGGELNKDLQPFLILHVFHGYRLLQALIRYAPEPLRDLTCRVRPGGTRRNSRGRGRTAEAAPSRLNFSAASMRACHSPDFSRRNSRSIVCGDVPTPVTSRVRWNTQIGHCGLS